METKPSLDVKQRHRHLEALFKSYRKLHQFYNSVRDAIKLNADNPRYDNRRKNNEINVFNKITEVRDKLRKLILSLCVKNY